MADGRRLIDWGLARRLARTMASGEEPGLQLDAELVGDVGEQALARVRRYAGLQPDGPIPRAEPVSREEWIELNLGELSALAAPLEERAAGELALPAPLGGIVRGAVGAAAGLEAGAVVGYASRRVLGQYQLSLGPDPGPARTVLLGRNLVDLAGEIDVEPQRFLMWVAVHEQTHALQFASVPWLRGHLAGLVAGLIGGASGRVDFGALGALARRLATRDPRRVVRENLRRELAQALAGPEQTALLDRVQATMAVIEGHAEHVMDAASADDPDLARMRGLIDERRARRSGLADLIARALGLGMKLRQYELGKGWADGVAAEAGVAGLNRVWGGPEALPTLAELEEPAAWLARVA